MIHKNPLAPKWTPTQKLVAFNRACRKTSLAYRYDDTHVPLNTQSIGKVEFIGGAWRVQRDIDYQVFTIRDKNFVIGPRINLKEKNYFEYYQIAQEPQYNCYGPMGELKFNMVAARYITDDGEYWSYGDSVPAARAFLGICLYDRYMDLIHSVACKNKMHKK